MRSPAEFAYAQARIQARQGDRLRDVDWKVLESAQSLSRYLERARSTSLRRFLAHIDPSSSPHDIDRALRREAALYAIEIASFAPPRWRPAIEWIAALPLLPLLDGARDRELPRSATGGDEAAVSAEFLIAAEAQRSIAAGLAALIRRDGTRVGVGLRWLRRWRALWPQGERAAGDLHRLIGQAMRALAPGRSPTGGRRPGVPPRSRSGPDARFSQPRRLSGRPRLPCRSCARRPRASARRRRPPQDVCSRRGEAAA